MFPPTRLHGLPPHRSSTDLTEYSAPRPRGAIETAQVIEVPIDLTRQLREANALGATFGLSPEEVASYDALSANDSAIAVLGDDQLRLIGREVADTVRANVAVDRAVHDTARANLRRLVRRVLRGPHPGAARRRAQTSHPPHFLTKKNT